MKLFQTTILLLAVLVFDISCSKDPEGIPVIKGTNVEREELMLADIASSIKEIRLETGDEIYVKSISSITKSDEHLYILDLDRIIKFRLDGSYVGEIAGKGEAPGSSWGRRGSVTIEKAKVSWWLLILTRPFCSTVKKGSLLDPCIFLFRST